MFEGNSGATIEGNYRYHLWRKVLNSSGIGSVLFIMLNPSTADDVSNDPTIRRCLSFAARWGFETLEVCNLFALRSSDPAILRSSADPIGSKNDDFIDAAVSRSSRIIAAWGADKFAIERAKIVSSRFAAESRFHCLGTTLSGAPKHPLYVRGDVQPEAFRYP